MATARSLSAKTLVNSISEDLQRKMQEYPYYPHNKCIQSCVLYTYTAEKRDVLGIWLCIPVHQEISQGLRDILRDKVNLLNILTWGSVRPFSHHQNEWMFDVFDLTRDCEIIFGKDDKSSLFNLLGHQIHVVSLCNIGQHWLQVTTW